MYKVTVTTKYVPQAQVIKILEVSTYSRVHNIKRRILIINIHKFGFSVCVMPRHPTTIEIHTSFSIMMHVQWKGPCTYPPLQPHYE